MHTSVLLNFIVFLAAFLLFQIELIVAKMLLPHYGGSYLVWGACVVFFQASLLLGYVLAYFSSQKMGLNRYRYIHLVLLLMPLFLFFPGKPLNLAQGYSSLPLSIDVFVILTQTIGPVFLMLSTISVIAQLWLAQAQFNQTQKVNPYYLYAMSNIGSFMALLSYPFLIEPFFDINTQLKFWVIGYVTFVALHVLVYILIPLTPQEQSTKSTVEPIAKHRLLLWFLLGAAGVIFFLAVNNIITYLIAPLPLFWIIPLCIYLLSFVFNFKNRPLYPRFITEHIPTILGLSVLLYFFITQKTFLPWVQVVLLCFILFILCMYCQNRLYTTRPQEKEQLSTFYVILALGGFVGGMITNWLVPLISGSLVEYILGVAVIATSLVIDKKIKIIPADIRFIVLLLFIIGGWPFIFYKFHIIGVPILIVIFIFIYKRLGTNHWALFLSMALILLLLPLYEMVWSNSYHIFVKRNFYGIYKVVDRMNTRELHHGTTLHGAQLIEGDRSLPLSYYGRQSPFGTMFEQYGKKFTNIGIIGLGVGTMTSYTHTHQTVDYYELDPDIYDIAQNYFSYIKNPRSKVNYFFGDARLELLKRPEKRYDLFVVDAFGGDAIPIHLITVEAIQEYQKHLSSNGMIMFHTSNRFFDILPVIAWSAKHLDTELIYKTAVDGDGFGTTSTWAIITWDKSFAQKLVDQDKWMIFPKNKKLVWWTDRFSSILPILKLHE